MDSFGASSQFISVEVSVAELLVNIMSDKSYFRVLARLNLESSFFRTSQVVFVMV